MLVEDTGTGIPPEEIGQIFKRFHRVKGVSGRTHEGTGIGLGKFYHHWNKRNKWEINRYKAMVYELVSIHGGSVKVTSEVDKGTTFTVTIPLGSSHLPSEQVKKLSKKRKSFETYSRTAGEYLNNNFSKNKLKQIQLM